jgi:quercetin dioxygenase-like cupin family protein
MLEQITEVGLGGDTRLVRPGEGRHAVAGGNDITFKIGPESGAEDLSMFESVVPPGGRVFPHVHREYEEAFYVLDGEVLFLLGDSWRPGAAGTIVHIARNVTHAFHNGSEGPARLLVIHTPASAIRMIEELAQLTPTSSREEMTAILGRHASAPVAVGAPSGPVVPTDQ